MQKDELIQMHALLCQLKHQLEATPQTKVGFPEYERLGVSPLHVHRSKTDHKRAIFVLGKEIAHMLSTGELSNPELVGNRFGALVHRVERTRAH